MTPSPPDTRQHTSHRSLVVQKDAMETPAASRPLDAIIVPNGRPAPYLKHVIAAAKQLDVVLLLLCSKMANASDAALAAKQAGVRAVAFDTDQLPRGLVPAFAADNLLRGDKFNRLTDTSFKRNLGLLIAAMAGWHRIVFLDDDIKLPRPEDLHMVAHLLDSYAAVGLNNAGMPDNSVVCLAFREAGGDQDTFIGGGALAVGRESYDSFFPNIYNEDWFFLLDGTRLRTSAMTGTAFQYDYDPYRDAQRARTQELGDTLAEGVFGLLDNGLTLADATEAYWTGFLGNRRGFIDRTIEMVKKSTEIGPAKKVLMVAALKGALGRSQLITPERCVRYMLDWQEDRARWRKHLGRHLKELRRQPAAPAGIDRALTSLGINSFAQRGAEGRIKVDALCGSFPSAV